MLAFAVARVATAKAGAGRVCVPRPGAPARTTRGSRDVLKGLTAARAAVHDQVPSPRPLDRATEP